MVIVLFSCGVPLVLFVGMTKLYDRVSCISCRSRQKDEQQVQRHEKELYFLQRRVPIWVQTARACQEG